MVGTTTHCSERSTLLTGHIYPFTLRSTAGCIRDRPETGASPPDIGVPIPLTTTDGSSFPPVRSVFGPPLTTDIRLRRELIVRLGAQRRRHSAKQETMVHNHKQI